ncbi:NACHT, LRR and PYD domains-containing protein 3-like [Lissotriton helveticus]
MRISSKLKAYFPSPLLKYLSLELHYRRKGAHLSQLRMAEAKKAGSASVPEPVLREEHKENYKERIIKGVSRMNPKTRRDDEYRAIKQRYQSLVIVKKPQDLEERHHETISYGMQRLAGVDEWSKLSSFSINAFFEPDEDGRTPRTVVLVGAAGFGKTRIARKILLDWAMGKLFQDRFEYVFNIPCRNPYQDMAEQTIETLALYNEPIYELTSKYQTLISRSEIEAEPHKVLFIIDFFYDLGRGNDPMATDPKKPSPKDNTLLRLIRKEYLPESYILITTRPAVLGSLTQRLTQCEEEKRFVEILRFSKIYPNEYFRHFFENIRHSELALNIVKKNDLLFTLCFEPVVSWIVCKAFKNQIREKKESVSDLRTTTSVYLLFLSSLLTPQSSDAAQSIFNLNLRRLCALAKEGIYKDKTFFKDCDVTRHGLDIPSIQSLFLTDDMFHKVDGTDNSYSFLHLSVQELFAALFYVLKDNETTEHTGSPGPDVIQILEYYSGQRYQHQWMLTVRFLFGLLSKERLDQMEKGFYWSVSSDVKPAVEKWIKEEIRREYFWTDEYYELDKLDWFHCLYETQDEEFVKSATEHLKEIKLHEPNQETRWNRWDDTRWNITRRNVSDCRALAFCLQNSLGVHQINFSVKIEPEGLQELMPGLMKCCTLRAPRGMPTFYLFGTALCESDIKCESLFLAFPGEHHLGISAECCDPGKHDESPITLLDLLIAQHIRLRSCSLTAAHCRDLSYVPRRNTSLTELDLSENELGDPGVRELCEGLKHPGCKIQKLVMEKCSLTGSCCTDLSSVLTTNPSLTDVVLSRNELGDSGVGELCEGLKHPGCKIQRLRLEGCSLTGSCCADLASVLGTNTSLTELNLSRNKLGGSGVRELCEGLKHPLCTLKTLR